MHIQRKKRKMVDENMKEFNEDDVHWLNREIMLAEGVLRENNSEVRVKAILSFLV